MRVRGGSSGLTFFAGVVSVCLALLAPGGAAAATVVNGNFETGNLSGWHPLQTTDAGNWFAYEGIEAPISSKRANGEPVQEPPQGRYAAITDEANPDTLILYQDIFLRPGYEHRLSLYAYYDSYKPIAIPTPDVLSVDEGSLGGQANQQYRIDVMRPDAPLDSIDPADVLSTVFRTLPGNSEEMLPTRFVADLSSFAGQTVRLRIANAVTEEVFNAGVDAVVVDSAPPGQLPPLKGPSKPRGSNSISFGKVKANPRNGSAILPVKVPGPGQLKARTATPGPATASKARKPRKLIKPVTVKVAKAGTVNLRLQPTDAARGILELRQKLRVRVAVTYAPSSGKPETKTVPVVLKLEARPRHRR
jgi:hypothetical protein